MAGAGAALYCDGAAEVWAEEEAGEENDEHPARAGTSAREVMMSPTSVLLPQATFRASVRRMRNPCVPMFET